MEYLNSGECVISEEQKLTYIGMYLLKKMDLKPQDGGMVLPIYLPAELAPLDDALQRLLYNEYISINRRKERYEITKKGFAYLGALIDEAEGLIEEFDDLELEEVVATLRARNEDALRARFLWGWYQGEFDDLLIFQERRSMSPVEPMWALFLVSDEFYNNLALDLGEEN